MIDDRYLNAFLPLAQFKQETRETDALPTLRSRNWMIPLLLATAIAGWAVIGAVLYGLWLLKCLAEAAIAIGWPV